MTPFGKTIFQSGACLLLCNLLISCASSGRITDRTTAFDPIAKLRNEIDAALADSAFYQTFAGIQIVSLQTGEVLYDRNSEKLFHPASNMKLLTTATALSRLGPTFRFKTVLRADTSALADSTISGNIYLKGSGNPDLTSDDLRWMVQQLKYKGVRQITGNLICDDSYFDDLSWGQGWMWDDVSAWYWAPISALTANDNCVTVHVKPAAHLGDSLIVQIEPSTSFMTIENLGTTVDSLDTNRIEQFKVERKWRPPENKVVVEGGLPVQGRERSYVIDVVDAPLYAGTLFSELLASEGIDLAGTVEKGNLPDTSVVLVTHLSPPLAEVVLNTNKISDNLSAENLLKTIAAEVRGTPGTARTGISEIYRFFQAFGVDSTTFRLADGSGVSRYNLISPAQIVELLKAMHSDFRVQAEFQTSLPIAGKDGTIDNRMQGTAAEGKLRAKTGSLSGVSTLSGYTTTADGERLAFSIMMEHFVAPARKIRDIQDRIGALISAFSRSPQSGQEQKYVRGAH